MGNSVLGYGLGLSSAAGLAPNFGKRVISIMGDGGFWHNGLTSGVAGAMFNQQDSVLVIMNNGYTSATGQQFIPSSTARDTTSLGAPKLMPIERALRMMGVSWVRTIRTYSVATMVKTLREAMLTTTKGLKVIIADGECQLARQRRIKPATRQALQAGLSGCPSLTIKPNPDPLREDPVAHVNNDCVGCGLCGEVAEAAVLCPSFYRADIVQNASWLDRAIAGWRDRAIAALRRLGGDAPSQALS